MQATKEQLRILLDTRETAEALSVSQRKVWELAESGALRSVRIGRSRRFDLRDIREYVNKLKLAAQ